MHAFMLALEVVGALTYRLLPCRRDDLDDVREVVGGVKPQEPVGYSVAAVHVAMAQHGNLAQELCTRNVWSNEVVVHYYGNTW